MDILWSQDPITQMYHSPGNPLYRVVYNLRTLGHEHYTSEEPTVWMYHSPKTLPQSEVSTVWMYHSPRTFSIDSPQSEQPTV